jgi:CBS-domain-containing membrane protein
MPNFALLKTSPLQPSTHFVLTREEYEPVRLEDPAIAVLTDFHIHPPYTTTENTPTTAALQQMKLSKVKSLFVVDAEDRVLGHVSARDIQSTKLMTVAQQNDIKQTEVTVKMLMVPVSKMHTLQFDELSNARVGHIVRLIHDLQVNYIFILDNEDLGARVRGMFSISRISRQLGENLTGDLSSQSVSEMNQLI